MESQTSARNGRASAGELAGRLGGDLRCMRCAYDLAGLSITSSCPECGLAIKATLLSVVDPKAEVLAPLVRPLLVAWSLVLWSLGGVLLVLAGWGARRLLARTPDGQYPGEGPWLTSVLGATLLA
ncbi:MAG: hypothetical protein AAFP26_12000, partial [Planctomycetota bacterium]